MLNRFRLWLTRPLELKLAAPLDAKRVAEMFIEDQFNRARWEMIPTQLTSAFDQNARREQLGALYAYAQVYERLGNDTPDDIENSIKKLSGKDFTEDEK